MRKPNLSQLSSFVRSRLSNPAGKTVDIEQAKQTPEQSSLPNNREKVIQQTNSSATINQDSANNSPRNSSLEQDFHSCEAGEEKRLPPVQENIDGRQAEQVPAPQPPKEIYLQEKLMPGPEPSHETNFLYIQLTRSFKKTTKEAFALSQVKELASPAHQFHFFLAVHVAIFVQNCFHNFSLVIQGFLSGLSVGHAFFAFVFADPGVLIRGYQWMAIPAQALFYFCYVISAINAFDRFEMQKSLQTILLNFVTLQKGSLIVIIWVAGCTCSILMTETDESLATWDLQLLANTSTQQINGTQDMESQTFNVLIKWRWLSCARALLALLGWLFMALQPSANYSRDHLANFILNFSTKVPNGEKKVFATTQTKT